MWAMYVLAFGLVLLGFSHKLAWVALSILVLVEANARLGTSDPLRMRWLGICVAVIGFAVAWFF